ncbi:UTRA domain-containing protein [Moraxella nonliquefaciens]|uniref:UTRA domain-containing protein n=1 Tax=Moraxella nonliquefaciens TaxID=478 RepID=UPI001EF716E6|nr:UTRA domain-containing protein [Moraxella nonliquefaciens]
MFDDTQRLYQVEIVHFTVNTSDYLISQVPLVRGCYFIEAMPSCPSDVASFLECQEDSPALCLSRYTYSGDKVVTFVQMWHDGATFRFDGTIG